MGIGVKIMDIADGIMRQNRVKFVNIYEHVPTGELHVFLQYFLDELAASAPRAQMTDDDAYALMVECMGTQAIDWKGTNAVCIEGPRDAGEVARAIAARSAPNAELVAALKEIALYRSNDWSGIQARKALAAVGENN